MTLLEKVYYAKESELDLIFKVTGCKYEILATTLMGNYEGAKELSDKLLTPSKKIKVVSAIDALKNLVDIEEALTL